MNIIDEYKRVLELIAIQESQLETAKRDLQKNMNTYKPADSKGIDYSKDKIQSSIQQQDILTTAKNIYILTSFIQETETELKQLNLQRKKLEDTIDDLGDTRKQIVMYRLRKYPIWKIANTLHISSRTVDRYIAQLKKEKLA